MQNADVLYVVCRSGYADTSKLQLLCLYLSNACREENRWSLLVAQGLPRTLLSWHLRGPDQSTLPPDSPQLPDLIGHGVIASPPAPPAAATLTPAGVNRLNPRRLIRRVVVDGGVGLEGVVFPAGVVRLEMGERIVGVLEMMRGDDGTFLRECGCRKKRCPQGRCSLRYEYDMLKMVGTALFERVAGGDCFHRPIGELALPAGLRQLELLGSFNEPVDQVNWPPGLELLVLGDRFNQKLVGVKWPSTLKSLTLGSQFNQSLKEMAWPPNLEHLQLGHSFNQDVSGVCWSPSLSGIHFGDRFMQPIKDAAWPESLRRLTFGHLFRQPIEDVDWPRGLEELRFGGYYNCRIEKVRWPEELQVLDLGRSFNRPIAKTQWPARLRLLTFGDCFNQPIEAVRWPSGLRVLRFGSNFDQDIAGVR